MPKYDMKPYHFGFLLGFNQVNFRLKLKDDFRNLDSIRSVESEPMSGFNVGIVTNLRLTEYLDLRFIPTLSFGDRYLNYVIGDSNKIFTDKKKVSSTFIDFPFSIKYKGDRIGNFRPYILGGLKYSFDLASQMNKKDVNEDQILVKIKRDDLLYEMGGGFDYYFPQFKFSLELKMGYGLMDMLKRDNTIYTKSIDKLRSKVFWISFLFE